MEEGDLFPEFELLTHKEEVIKSSELKGTPFVVFAYPRADTPGCIKEACSIRDHYQELKDKGYRIFGISNDPPKKNAKFVEKYSLNYDLLCDTETKLLKELGAFGEKKYAGKSYTGTLRYTYIVDEKFIIRKLFKKVKVAIHGEELLSAISEIN